MAKRAIIIGAGPAGLTAAIELLKRTDIQPIILEKSGDIGGISKTVNYKGNRIDIGGHRFFSKSDRVMDWWLDMMPLETDPETPPDAPFTIRYRQQSREIRTPTPSPSDPVKTMLIRPRLSRIYFLRQFFSYPVRLSFDTLRKLGLLRTLSISFSYLRASLYPIRPETSLEDFLINRFGYRLYRLFFSDYTEKVWGIPCRSIPAEWGAQRIRGVSFRKALYHALSTLRPKKENRLKKDGRNDLQQKDTETSLIDRFLYPRLGPGQLWEEAARIIKEKGGLILMDHDIRTIHAEDGRITGVEAVDPQTENASLFEGDYFFSTMPVKRN